jgi:hypothetical protein
MVNMAMGDEDLLNLDARLLHRIHDAVKIPARVNNSTNLGLIIINDGTILLERCDRNDNDFELFHDAIEIVILAHLHKKPAQAKGQEWLIFPHC